MASSIPMATAPRPPYVPMAQEAKAPTGPPPPNRRLNLVRHRLLALDYQEAVGIESLPLVERLLEDLVKTTESFRGLQEHDERLSQDLGLAQVRERDIVVAVPSIERSSAPPPYENRIYHNDDSHDTPTIIPLHRLRSCLCDRPYPG